MAATLTLDRFELLWYLQGGMHGSHLRWSIYEDFVDKVYPQLSDSERDFVYTYAKRDLDHWNGKKPEELEYSSDKTPCKYFRQLLARFCPANQYIVTMKYKDGKETVVDSAYLWDGRYYISYRRSCAEEYIVKVEQKEYNGCGNSFCASKDKCLRYGKKCKEDDRLFGTQKCDTLIMQEELDYYKEKHED